LRLTTSYGICDDGPVAAIDWRFPAETQVPFNAINAILAAHYSLCAAGKGDPPYLYIVEKGGLQVGLFVADISNVDASGQTVGVDIAGEAGLTVFNSIMEEEAAFPQLTPWQPGNWNVQTAWREDMGLGVIRWKLPNGQIFPVDCLNSVLYGMYADDDGYRPYFYPVFDPEDSSGMTPQIGVLLSVRRDESGTSEQFAAKVTEDFRGLMSFSSEEKFLPWKQEVFDVD